MAVRQQDSDDESSERGNSQAAARGSREAGNGAGAGRTNPKQTVKQMFLQTMLARRMLTAPMARDVYNKCLELCKVEDGESIENFIASVEEELTSLGLEIKTSARDQETGVSYFILINTMSDSISKLATEYTASEVTHFRNIVEHIMTAPKMSYCISMKDALRCSSTGTRAAGQNVIRSLVAKGWLTLHPSQYLTLSTRSLAELNTWLRETYNDDEDVDQRYRAVVDCNACFGMVTSGYACPNENCDIRLHSYCTNFKLGAAGKCPASIGNPGGCSQQWDRVQGQGGGFVGVPVGLGAVSNSGARVSETPVESSPRKLSQAAKAQGRRRGGRARGQALDSDDEDDGEDMLDSD